MSRRTVFRSPFFYVRCPVEAFFFFFFKHDEIRGIAIAHHETNRHGIIRLPVQRYRPGGNPVYRHLASPPRATFFFPSANTFMSALGKRNVPVKRFAFYWAENWNESSQERETAYGM